MKPQLKPEPMRTCLAPRRTPRLVTSAPTPPIQDEASGIENVEAHKPGLKVRIMEALIILAALFALFFGADLCVRVLLKSLPF